jgi:hypothetical protein
MRSSDENTPCDDRGCDCLRFRDAWTAGSIYRPGDAVPYQGSSYVAIHWNQNDPPPSANWATIASKGDAGPAGPAGAQGPAGAPGESSASDLYKLVPTDAIQAAGFSVQGDVFASLTVPAGSYLITGAFPLVNTDGDKQGWSIEVWANDTLLTQVLGELDAGGSAGCI